MSRTRSLGNLKVESVRYAVAMGCVDLRFPSMLRCRNARRNTGAYEHAATKMNRRAGEALVQGPAGLEQARPVVRASGGNIGNSRRDLSSHRVIDTNGKLKDASQTRTEKVLENNRRHPNANEDPDHYH